MRLVTVGIIAPSSESAAALRNLVRATGFGTVVAEVGEYSRSKADAPSRRLVDARPEVILIDAAHTAAAVECVQILHAVLPAAWVLACTPTTDAASILQLVRAGARELIPSPVTQDAVTRALERHIEERNRERRGDDAARGKLYSVCSAKRGCGATTVAINLAAALAEAPETRVSLIDLDWPLGDAAAYLNIRPNYTISDALNSSARLDAVLLETFMHSHSRMHVLAGLEDFNSGGALNAPALDQLLEVATHAYSHTVIDLPLSLNRDLLEMVAGVSTEILAVLTPDLPSLRRTERLLRFFAGLKAADKVRLVLNRGRKIDEITERDVEKALKQPVSWRIGNDYYACMEAINAGKALVSTSNKHVSRDFREMARQLGGFPGQEKRRGLLSLLPTSTVV